MKTVNVDLRLDESEELLLKRALKKAGVREKDVSSFSVIKKAIDARNKRDIKFCYVVALYFGDEPKDNEYFRVGGSVVVVGAGPAGLFAALELARHGVAVTVIERGSRVEERSKTVKAFFDGGKLDENTNVQFGEGGAGTFSDGKLNTQVNNPLVKKVLEDFVRFGAPSDVLYLNKPHVGSDNLPKVVKNVREEIIRLGGRFSFNEKMTSLLVSSDGSVCGVKTDKGEYLSDCVVLAIGHSSRDTFSYLFSAGVAMEGKDFAVGFRIEQRQEVIDRDRYGDFYAHPKLSAADYKLISHASERAVFTFCMCPGGVVVPSASEQGGLVVNGMSNYLRNGENANSAVVCQVKKDDFGTQILGGVEFQKKIERLAYAAIGDYAAPVQLADDFIADRASTRLCGVTPTYSRGFGFYELKKLLPLQLIESLKAGLYDMNGKINGFASCGAVLTGVESRTSSPVRIVRGENSESVSHKNLYPCGEGCGYAGGITSACVDGIKVSSAIIDKLIEKYKVKI